MQARKSGNQGQHQKLHEQFPRRSACGKKIDPTAGTSQHGLGCSCSLQCCGGISKDYLARCFVVWYRHHERWWANNNIPFVSCGALWEFGKVFYRYGGFPSNGEASPVGRLRPGPKVGGVAPVETSSFRARQHCERRYWNVVRVPLQSAGERPLFQARQRQAGRDAVWGFLGFIGKRGPAFIGGGLQEGAARAIEKSEIRGGRFDAGLMRNRGGGGGGGSITPVA